MGTRNARAKLKARRQEQLRRQRQSETAKGNNSAETGLACQVSEESVPRAAEQPAGCAAKSAPCGPSNDELSTIKQVAAAALILGQSVSKTAESLGVDRRTVQRWSKFDPEFQLAMQETKLEVVITSRQSLLALAESAVEMVESKLSGEQSPRVALSLLRGMGILGSQMLIPPPLADTEGENEKRAQSATLAAAEQTEQAANATAEPQPTQPETAAAEAEEIYEWSDLLPEQQVAIAHIFAGQTMAEVAELTSTSEDTIRGWLCQDRRFFTLLSGFQLDRLARLKYRLLRLTAHAISIVQQAIAGGDARVAMVLLRGLGLMK